MNFTFEPSKFQWRRVLSLMLALLLTLGVLPYQALAVETEEILPEETEASPVEEEAPPVELEEEEEEEAPPVEEEAEATPVEEEAEEPVQTETVEESVTQAPALSGEDDYDDSGDDSGEDNLSGSCGDNAVWRFDPETGVLTISSADPDYYYSSVEYVGWPEYTDSIQTVVIEDGIRCLYGDEGGGELFYTGKNLTSVHVPASVRSINAGSFCTLLWDDENETEYSAAKPGLTIYAPENSCAFVYAKQYGISFEAEGTALPLTALSTGENTIKTAYDSFVLCTFVPEEDSMYHFNESTDTQSFSLRDASYRYVNSRDTLTAGNTYYVSFVAGGDTVSLPISAVGLSGDCGDGVSWSINRDESLLTISGSGAITSTPWRENDLSSFIANVVIQNGVTGICDNAFSWYYLESVTIPATVTGIGSNAIPYASRTVVYGQEGSAAQRFAAENLLSFNNEPVALETEDTLQLGEYDGTALGLTKDTTRKLFRFTADHSGIYYFSAFSSSDGMGISCTLFGPNGRFIDSSDDYIGTRLSAGSTCFVLLSIYDEPEYAHLTVSYYDPSDGRQISGDLKLDETVTAQIDYDQSVYYTFTPEETATYDFIFSDNVDEGTLFDDTWDGLQWFGGNSLRYRLTGGQTYILRVHRYTPPASVDITVNRYDASHGRTISGKLTLDESTVVQYEESSSKYYSFTAPDDDIYSIVTSHPNPEYFLCCSLYDGEWEHLSKDYGSGENGNILLNQFLSAGETVIIGLEYNGAGEVPLTVKKMGTSGICGDGVNWEFDKETGKLTISGTGEMTRRPWWPYSDQIKSVEIGSGVTCIVGSAFSYCSNLTSITIPASVTSIGSYAFSDCTSLTNVTIPDSVISIGDSAFSNCSNLTSITIPDSVTSIGSYAFSDCTSLTNVTIPDSVISIGYSAFSYCSNLTSITIPASVTRLDDDIFYGYYWDDEAQTGYYYNPNLTIYGAEYSPAHVYAITNYVKFAPQGTPVKVEALTEGQGREVALEYKQIVLCSFTPASSGTYVFESNPRMKVVVRGEGLNSIIAENPNVATAELTAGETCYVGFVSNDSGTFTLMAQPLPTSGSCGENARWSFNRDTGALTISGNGRMTDRPWWYYYQDEIKSVDIQSGITSICESAFYRCSNLTSVTIADSVREIKYDAFSNCTNLKSVAIPGSVSKVGNYAFAYCTGLETVSLAEGITTIGGEAFFNCTGLTNLTIPASVSTIWWEAFHKYDSEYDNYAPLPGLTLSGYADSYAQRYAEENNFPFTVLGTADFGSPNVYYGDVTGNATRVSAMENNTIAVGDTKTAQTKISRTSAYYSFVPEQNGVYQFTTTADAKIYLYAYTEGRNPKRIASGKGEVCRELEAGQTYWARAILSNGKTGSINVTLTEVQPSGTMANGIQWSYADGTLSITGKGVVEEKPWADMGLQITKVFFGDGITGIGTYGLFSRVNTLTSVSIPSTMTDLGSGTFSRTGLESVIIPAGVKRLGLNVFQRCSNLDQITFLGSAPEIAYNSFWCDTLKVTYNARKTGWKTAASSFYGAYRVEWESEGEGEGISIADAVLSEIADQTYTGEDIVPAVTVTLGDAVLTPGVDYEVICTGNQNVGDATVTVSGLGDYLGEVTGTFKIVPASIEKAVVTADDQTYTGDALTPTAKVMLGEQELVKNTDYEVAYSNNINAGTATITITGIGNYNGSVTGTFTIQPASISSGTITLGTTAYTYTGSAIKPTVTMKVGTVILKADTDYTVAYQNNVNAGTATVTVTAKENYTGTKSATFKINAASLNGATVTAAASTYTGKALTPAVTVKLNGKTLTKGTDYTVAYKNNTNAGTATVSVTGKGNYNGTASGTFQIKKAAQTLTVSAPSNVLVGKTIKVTAKGVGKLSYKSSNAKVAAVNASGVITGKGAGKATITVTAAGDANRNAASKTVTINVLYSNPKITKAENTGKGVKITWTKQSGVAACRVFYKIGKGKWTKAGDSTGTSFAWSKAKSGTAYSFTVRAISKVGSNTYTSGYDTTGTSLSFVAAPTLSKLTNSKAGTMTATWGKVSGVGGYQIQYSLNKNFSGAKTVKAKASAASATINKLTKNKTYYVRMRSYATVSGKTVYSPWSRAKTLKITK